MENPPPTTLSVSSGQTASAVPIPPGGMVVALENTCTIWMFCIASVIAPVTKSLMSSSEGIIVVVPFTMSGNPVVVVSGISSAVVAYVGTSIEVVALNSMLLP